MSFVGRHDLPPLAFEPLRAYIQAKETEPFLITRVLDAWYGPRCEVCGKHFGTGYFVHGVPGVLCGACYEDSGAQWLLDYVDAYRSLD
jgi:hypothetical protein